MSEASIPKMKLLVSRLAKKMVKTTVQSEEKTSDDDQSSDDIISDGVDSEIAAKSKNILQKDCDDLNRVYLSPMIAELKETNVI